MHLCLRDAEFEAAVGLANWSESRFSIRSSRSIGKQHCRVPIFLILLLGQVFEEEADTLFRLVHQGTFNASIQALMLLYHVSC